MVYGGRMGRVRKWEQRARGAVMTKLIHLAGGSCGDGLRVDRGATFRWGAHPGIHLGAGVYLGRGVVIDVPPGAELHLGDNVKIMHYSVIAAGSSVRIGRLTQVAEHCSIRDSDHGLALGTPVAAQSVS